MVPGSQASKLGHPQPESNFWALVNSTWPHPPHVKTPSASTCNSEPVNGASVAASRSTAYRSAGNSARHSSLVLSTS